MDGLLVIDKPAGPTSHDVVARVRRVLRERRVGHTGTLDPMATGVLPLVIGRATRLAQFMSGSGKSYRAVIRLGVRTDSGDAEGEPIGPPWEGPLPAAAAIDAALDAFRGSILQQPPAFSAKKVHGRRSYALARAQKGRHEPGGPAAAPKAVPVTVHRLVLAAFEGDRATVEIDCSAGFYVRALADELGRQLGVGAHVAELRRTRHGEFTLSHAVPLDELEADPDRAAAKLLPLRALLTSFDAVTLTPAGVEATLHGRELPPSAWMSAGRQVPTASSILRLLSPEGELVGIARPSNAAGFLHPFVVLR